MNQQNLPNATAVLILGIISIVTCLCYGLPGIICGIVALVLYSKDIKLYKASPELYLNYSNLNTGRILAIIGIVLNVLYIVYIVVMISLIGFEALKDPDLLKEKIQELQGL